MFCVNCGKPLDFGWNYCVHCGFRIGYVIRKTQLLDNLDESKKILFDRLKKERQKIAETKGVPPYVIAHDSLLLEICQAMPTTEEEMLQVRGIRTRKLEWVKEFIPIIKEHCNPSKT
ncbi:MAG: HRDC domain-containing protein [archaeon]|nr:HRDC domain-containing protein [archaeon]